MRWQLRSKIHQATVTEADVRYVGSITIDEDLMDRVGLWAGEKVLVTSDTSGACLETYVIPGRRASGTIAMNGAAAHVIKQGEQIIIMGFELAATPIQPTIALLDSSNRVMRELTERADMSVEAPR